MSLLIFLKFTFRGGEDDELSLDKLWVCVRCSGTMPDGQLDLWVWNSEKRLAERDDLGAI